MKQFNGVRITEEQGKEYLEDLFEWQDDYESYDEFFEEIQEINFERENEEVRVTVWGKKDIMFDYSENINDLDFEIE